jgi:peptidoglycan-associated lipoprotein
MKAVVVLVFAASLGCSANPPPDAKAPSVATAGTAAQPAAPAKAPLASPPNSPTASAVRIDDAILKACGIQAPKAFFAFDSAHLEQYDTKVLEQVAACFTTGPLKGRGLRLVGHADPRGETEYNFVLGSSRADAVAGFLGTKGMDKAKVDTTSRGELDATGTDESGWAKDRRVDVLLGR